MRATDITKEKMFKLVKVYAGTVDEMYKDDYFAMAKSADDCKFELREDKAVLRFKGVEIFPDDYEGEKEQEAENFTTATLCRKAYTDYENKMCCWLSVDVEEMYNIEFEVNEDLLELCGIVFE